MSGIRIGDIVLRGRAVLAPMAGYGDIAFRRLCRDYGAALTTTEMISAKGLLYGNENTERLLRLAENESPSCVQLFGGDPDVLYRAACLPQIRAFDIVDINMGCPVPKVVKNGEGSALGRDVDRAAACVAALKAGSGRPVTAKFRLGFDMDDFTAPKLAVALEKAGVAAVAVHGRYAAQMYRGRADWEKIVAVKNSVSVPVFGNGDIASATQAEARLRVCDGIMIGRGALGHPELFAELLGGIGDGLKNVLFRHIEYMHAYFPADYTVKNMRKHLAYYLHGVPDTRAFKQQVNAIDDIDALRAALDETLA